MMNRAALLSDRRLGKAHINSASCECKYCSEDGGLALFDGDTPNNSRGNVPSKSGQALLRSKENSGSSAQLTDATAPPPENIGNSDEYSTTVSRGDPHNFDAAHSGSSLLQRNVETRSGMLSCNQCNASFKTKQILKNHKLVHTDERPFSCTKCNASFKRKKNLVVHAMSHTGLKPFTCIAISAMHLSKQSVF
ncbi:Gastrula zinc finger protein xLCGF3.1 [Capsicum chinense]|nr:Gastrula zinc finger protein xLCGF3.1 [Capsicum chinense]